MVQPRSGNSFRSPHHRFDRLRSGSVASTLADAPPKRHHNLFIEHHLQAQPCRPRCNNLSTPRLHRHRAEATSRPCPVRQKSHIVRPPFAIPHGTCPYVHQLSTHFARQGCRYVVASAISPSHCARRHPCRVCDRGIRCALVMADFTGSNTTPFGRRTGCPCGRIASATRREEPGNSERDISSPRLCDSVADRDRTP